MTIESPLSLFSDFYSSMRLEINKKERGVKHKCLKNKQNVTEQLLGQWGNQGQNQI